MIRFKQFIFERDSFKDSVIRQRGFGSLMLTPTLIKALEKNPAIIDSLRVIGLTQLLTAHKDIKRTGGTSTFTNSVDYYATLKGMQTNGGILLKLRGTPIISSKTDFESDVDTEGNKYIPVRSFKFWENGSTIQKLLTDMTNKFYDKAFELLGVEQKSKFTVQSMIDEEYLGFIDHMIKDFKQETISELIEYSDKLMDELISKNLKLIVSTLQDARVAKAEIDVATSIFDWNEISLGNAEIQEIFLVQDILSADDITKAKIIIKTKLKLKVPKLIKSQDLKKIITKIAKDNK